MNTFRPNLFDSYTFLTKKDLKRLTMYLTLAHHTPMFRGEYVGWALPIFTMIHNNPVKFMCVESKSLIHGLQLFLDNNE